MRFRRMNIATYGQAYYAGYPQQYGGRVLCILKEPPYIPSSLVTQVSRANERISRETKLAGRF